MNDMTGFTKRLAKYFDTGLKDYIK